MTSTCSPSSPGSCSSGSPSGTSSTSPATSTSTGGGSSRCVLVALGVAGLAGILRTKDDEPRDQPADAVTDAEPVEVTDEEGAEAR